MGGEHSDEFGSTAREIVKQKCAHGCYNPGGLELNRMCSVCMSTPAPEKELTKAEVTKLNNLTQDLSETDQAVESAPDGTIKVSVPMKSNDIVLIKLERSQGGQLSQAGRDKASR